MAKDQNDKRTRDFIEPTRHGGAGRGQGRKPSGKPPKKPLPCKVSKEARDKLKLASEKTGKSQASIIEYLIQTMEISEE